MLFFIHTNSIHLNVNFLDSLIAVDNVNRSVFRFNTYTNAVNSAIPSIIPIVNESIESIAFDYFGKNLYISDSDHKKIDVYSLTTSEKAEFPFTSSPRDLIVVPEEGFVTIYQYIS